MAAGPGRAARPAAAAPGRAHQGLPPAPDESRRKRTTCGLPPNAPGRFTLLTVLGSISFLSRPAGGGRDAYDEQGGRSDHERDRCDRTGRPPAVRVQPPRTGGAGLAPAARLPRRRRGAVV